MIFYFPGYEHKKYEWWTTAYFAGIFLLYELMYRIPVRFDSEEVEKKNELGGSEGLQLVFLA